jgi:hypothetical protein
MIYKLWSGLSQIDRSSEIVLLASDNSSNAKTGPMIQTWILRTDKTPREAINDGSDSAVCGSCPHRGTSCYVQVDWRPRQVWDAYQAGKYETPDPAELVRDQLLRIGSYGNPSAAPYEVWEPMIHAAKAHTGYEHEWRTCDQRFSQYLMASVEDEVSAAQAQAMGWRTFRVAAKRGLPTKGEVLCPASEEAGGKLTCAQCLHCRGASHRIRGNVFIPVHGSPSKIQAFDTNITQIRILEDAA